MYFKKFDHPGNFAFDKSFDYQMEVLGDDVFKLTVESPRWHDNFSQAELDEAAFANLPSRAELQVSEYSLSLQAEGGSLLQSLPERMFGVAGSKWMFCFAHRPHMQFYGLGEKNNGFEKTGVRSKFWNTDVFADFHMHQIETGVTDPMYVSVPYLLVKQGNVYCGILADNPFDAFVSLRAQERIENQQGVATEDYFMLGSTDGRPTLYFIYGPSLADTTRKLQRLCGCHARPPLWALGHQQCRWGYKSARELAELDQRYRQANIPTDGLWLDIDYMDKFKVFTFDPVHFEQPKREFAELRRKGRRSLVILDPGVRIEPGYPVYDSGRQENVFCRNREGGEYVGFVWPGATVFPDFSMPEARDWWARQTAMMLGKSDLDGFWLDMNDPSTGSSVLDEMLFQHGQREHGSYHNQYAFGMQKATFDGCLRHRPERRPFLVSRSGYISTSRYSAVWTGDNIANYYHLRQSIPMCLNLSLSGIPFCGPDVPGFGGDPTPGLARDWYKAGFLFPFFRNHSIKNARKKEPWTFDRETCGVIGHFIRLRYKLIPYLYQLFVEHEQKGDPMLRPLFYEFDDSDELPLGMIDDQFMVGSHIMQAPFVEPGTRSRRVVLPGAGPWFDPWSGQWFDGGQTITVRRDRRTTPVFIRAGAVIPMLRQVPDISLQPELLRDLELHVFAPPEARTALQFSYQADDGESFAYRQGKVSETIATIRIDGGKTSVETKSVKEDAGAVKFTVKRNCLFEAMTES